MKTNVKPGDLAVLVRAMLPENLGKVCVVLEPGLQPGWWLVEFPRPVRWLSGESGVRGEAWDGYLRPLRDNDGEDEMLRIAGKPQTAEDLAVRISTLREEFDEACRRAVEV